MPPGTSNMYQGSRDFLSDPMKFFPIFVIFFLVFHPCLSAHGNTLSLLLPMFIG